MPDFSIEKKINGNVAGVDEAGRGSWAGPVVAAAVIFEKESNYQFIKRINDSKKLSAKTRNALYIDIVRFAFVGIGQATVKEIDSLNILKATHLAMRRAVEELSKIPNVALVDGNSSPCLDLPTKLIIKGDSISTSIAAASIVAKVSRDQEMVKQAKYFPAYGFDSHKGYGTKMHMHALEKFGPSQIHRKSFRPVKNYYANIC